MANIKACLSKKRHDYCTPKPFYDSLNRRWNFTHDCACDAKNRLAPKGITEKQDALKVPWGPPGSRCFCNPPYRIVAKFVARAWEMAESRDVVLLIPSRTDTRWWHEFIWDKKWCRFRDGVHVEFLKGRIKFKGEKNGAPFPSCVVTFGRRDLAEGNERVLATLAKGDGMSKIPGVTASHQIITDDCRRAHGGLLGAFDVAASRTRHKFLADLAANLLQGGTLGHKVHVVVSIEWAETKGS